METPVVFPAVTGAQLVGMLHIPARGAASYPGVVMLHGFTGSKHEAHRLFVVAARRFCEAGLAVLRFDFRGSGDSAGGFDEMSITTEIEDAHAALRYVRQHAAFNPQRLSILGMSMGGLVAASVLAAEPSIRAAVLWCPVAKPAPLMSARLNSQMQGSLSSGGVADFGGWPIGRALVADLATRDPIKAFAASTQPALILHGDADETVPLSDSRLYVDCPRRAPSATLEIIAGADHTYSSLLWTEQVVARSAAWLGQQLCV